MIESPANVLLSGPVVPDAGARSATIYIPLISVNAGGIHDVETKLFLLINGSDLQERPSLRWDKELARIAREYRSQDMIDRQYVSHITPGGFGPNFILTSNGIELPRQDYGRSRDLRDNNIESIASGFTDRNHWPDADLIFGGFVTRGTEAHLDHLFGRNDFFRGQTRMGIGIAVVTAEARATATKAWAVTTIWTLHDA